jgi:hypothetical protein
MKAIPIYLTLGLLFFGLTQIRGSETTITKTEDNKYIVNSDFYTACVTPDGKLRSFKVGDAEFLSSAGCYLLANKKTLGFGKIVSTNSGVLSIQNSQSSLKITFASDGMLWSIGNISPSEFTLFLVLSKEASVFEDEGGRYFKTPVRKEVKRSAWFIGESCLDIDAALETWGPWGEDWQVLNIALPPGEERQIRFKVRKATSEEAAKVKSVLSGETPPTSATESAPTLASKSSAPTPPDLPLQ